MTNGEPKERRETRETDRSHRLTITSKPFNHQQWSQDGGDRRWPLEVIERRVIRIPGVPRFHVSTLGSCLTSCRFPFLFSLRAAGGSREAALLVRKVDDMTGENEETDRARRDVSGSVPYE